MACESSFSTIELVGEMINEDPDLLRQISVKMEPEDGCVAIYGKNDENIIAFSDFGIETLVNLLKEIRSLPGGLKEYLATEI
ncbi:MAG: hypothetical protein QNL16_06210 [Rhodobacterales bacterium]|jgi:hypothetical protein|nr:hypothetical protein [Pseudomonadota bacterium]MDA1286407.1 hypothetical protein [Pseudomonadota bacterium]